MRRSIIPALVVAALAVSTACNTVGPRSVGTALTSYDLAVGRTKTEQLLLNLVRLRYRDVPIFLQINSISAQYQFEMSAGAAGKFDNGDSSVSALGGIGFTEKPTLSMTPLQGKDFVKQMLSPIPAEAVALLFHSGWKIDRILLSLVQAINRVPFATNASSPTPDDPPEYVEFKKLAANFRALQRRHLIDLGIEKNDDGRRFFMMVAPEARDSEEMREITKALDLKPGLASYEVGSSIYPHPGEIISINMRSLSGVLYFLSHGVEVPERDVRDGLVTVTRDEDGEIFEWGDATNHILRVRSSDSRPKRAAVAVSYRGHWFYIDDADLHSKSTFSMLFEVVNLLEGGVEATGPVLTLPLQ